MYHEIFKDKQFEEEDIHEANDDSKIYKISYILNLLPNIDESTDSLMEACGETDELEIFECKVLRDFIEFKWNSYAGKYHYIGASIHACYLITFNFYVSYFLQQNYIPKGLDESGKCCIMSQDDTERLKNSYIKCYIINLTLMFCLIYPLIYDMTQLL